MITLKNLENHKTELIKRCKKNNLNPMELNKLKKMKDKGFRKWFIENFSWVNDNKIFDVSGTYQIVFPFNNGISKIKKDGLWGYLKEDGDFLIEPKFKYLPFLKKELLKF